MFTRDAVLAVHQHSGGIPRTINVICENALLTGYVEEQRPVGRDVVEAVVRDFDLWSTAVVEPPVAPSSRAPIAEPLETPSSDVDVSVKPVAERSRGWAIWRR